MEYSPIKKFYAWTGFITWNVITILLIASFFSTTIIYEPSSQPERVNPLKHKVGDKTVEAYITGYNTVSEQTDDTPCLAAGGNICGRIDTVACPRSIPLGTWIDIEGKKYECMDRLAKKYDDRFDINCDKNMTCPYEVTGKKIVTIHEVPTKK